MQQISEHHHHLIRRGAGAEDEVLGEAVPAELGVSADASGSCEKQSCKKQLRHSGPDTHVSSW